MTNDLKIESGLFKKRLTATIVAIFLASFFIIVTSSKENILYSVIIAAVIFGTTTYLISKKLSLWKSVLTPYLPIVIIGVLSAFIIPALSKNQNNLLTNLFMLFVIVFIYIACVFVVYKYSK